MQSNAEPPDDWGALSQLPGNPIMWVLIISEILVFGAFFLSFAVARALHPAEFAAGQASLDFRLGGLNTLILITSGFCAARAVEAGARQAIQRARQWLASAATLGLAFLAIKSIEYADKAAHGAGLDTNVFYTLFFLITGFHALHVAMGIVILAIVGWRTSLANLETGVSFWHMIDLIWLILFPLIYLLR